MNLEQFKQQLGFKNPVQKVVTEGERTTLHIVDTEKRNHILVVPTDRYTLWKQGMHIQHAFPNMSADNRELILSGIAPDTWEETFKDEE